MPRSQINGNFIDKTSSIVANILLRIIPTTSGEKEAFTYCRDVPIGGVGEEALHLGINKTKTLLSNSPFFLSGSRLPRMVRTTNIHLVHTLDTRITIKIH
ncbi:unnamed protein product [Victoria cruziana]